MAKIRRIICPNCKAEEKDLDYWIDNDGNWNWNCFDCGHEWKIHNDRMLLKNTKETK